jgi:hypothetical protein
MAKTNSPCRAGGGRGEEDFRHSAAGRLSHCDSHWHGFGDPSCRYGDGKFDPATSDPIPHPGGFVWVPTKATA